MTSRDTERQELDRAIELMGRGTRPARLLEFLGSKYFSQQEAQLTEFDIAREVFGRSVESFDPAADAVVRVEIHRLRKKLRDLYEKDTRTAGMQISLPAGTYVPRFTVIPASPSSGVGTRERRSWPTWARVVAGLAAVGVVTTAFLFSRDRDEPKGRSSVTADTASPASTPPGAVDEVHLVAGYTGSEIIDNSGVRWTPDKYYAAGGTWTRQGPLRGTSRPFLFKTWRTGEFGYNLPLVPGTYELRLYFASGQPIGEEKLSGFSVSMNGQSLLRAYDIAMSADGADVADEQVFRDVRPDADGLLKLWFSNETTSPVLNALEVVPGTPGKLKPIRILTQRTSFVDHQGQRWRADDHYQNGFLSSERNRVQGTEDPELFNAERFGHFKYAIPVDRRGLYTVKLHFAEFYYGPQLPGGGGVGSRVFHVFCNGQTLLRDFDIYKESGSLRLVTKTFQHIRPSAYGKINLVFEPVENNATVSGIEVIDESE